jgi:glucokinase
VTLAIGVDVGGTKVAAGVVDEDGRIIAKLKRSTPAASPARTEQAIADAVTELLAGHRIAAIGLGAAGFVDSARATMLFAPNLAWRDEPLKQRVEERLGREVVVENDANASAWAEARFGAARGYRDAMLVALGTGIGAAVLIGGELYRGRWGIAAWYPTGGCADAGTAAAGSSTAAATPWSPRRVSSPGARRAPPSGCCSWATGRPRASRAR